jgi:hypothetical protein
MLHNHHKPVWFPLLTVVQIVILKLFLLNIKLAIPHHHSARSESTRHKALERFSRFPRPTTQRHDECSTEKFNRARAEYIPLGCRAPK